MKKKNAKSGKVRPHAKKQQAIPSTAQFYGQSIAYLDDGAKLFYIPASQTYLIVSKEAFDTASFTFIDRAAALKLAIANGETEAWQLLALTDPKAYLADRKQWLRDNYDDPETLQPGDEIDKYGNIIRPSK